MVKWFSVNNKVGFVLMMYLFLALLLAAADQLSKGAVVGFIDLGEKVDVLPGIVGLTHTQNTGMAFSMLSNKGWLLPVVSGVLILILIVVLLAAKLKPFERVCLSLVLGGAIGNCVDRVLFGHVVDMIEVQFVNFAIFNFADCCIVVGGILFMIAYIFFHDKGGKKKEMSEISRLKDKETKSSEESK